MIRVLHVITTLSTGGAEMTLARLVPAMDRSRFESRVVCLAAPGALALELRDRGVPVESLRIGRGSIRPQALFAFQGRLLAYRPRVVMTWLYHADLLGALTVPFVPGARLVWNLRCSDMDLSRYSRLTRAVRSSCARMSFLPAVVVANSHAGLARHREMGYHPRRFLVIPNGVDPDRFRPD
ncbi:MAG: glycosyltransferase, partial [Thermodesulfobacteriota bacterium]